MTSFKKQIVMYKILLLSLVLLCLWSCDDASPNLFEGMDSPKRDLSLTLDRSLVNANQAVEHSIDLMLEQINNTVAEKEQLKPFSAAAKNLVAEISPLVDYLDRLRSEMSAEGIYLYLGEFEGRSAETRKAYYEQKEGISVFKVTEDKALEGQPVNANDRAIVKKLLFDEGKAEELGQLMLETRYKLLEIVDALVSINQSAPIRGISFDKYELQTLKNQLSLKELNLNEGWAENTFSGVPVGACYPLLRNYQNEAKASVAQVLKYLADQMGLKVLVYDKIDVFASSEKPYILLGETYEAEIGLGAYSSQAEFSVSVNGRNLQVMDGKAKYTARAASVGTQFYTANILVVNPLTGETERVTKRFEYEVGVPATTVAADKMNVFYVGVENPISIAAAGISSNDLKVMVSGGGAQLKKSGKGRYSLTCTKPTTRGNYCTISLSNQRTGRKLASYSFRVKPIPDPVAQLTNGKTDGVIKAAEMRAMPGVMAVLENFDFDAKCKIQGFTLHYIPQGGDAVEMKVTGGRFTAKSLQAVQSAKSGDAYLFTNVKGRCPGDMAGRKLNGLAFMIR